MKKALFLAAALAAAPACAERIDAPALNDLPEADVVVLGEVHDNPAHHANQARAVAALAPSAVVFEMLTPEQAAKVTSDLRADRAALQAALGWDNTGWPDFAMYHPIFTASDAAIYGAALPREEVRRAVEDGAAAVFGEQASAYGLAGPLPADQQKEREDLQRDAHCNALPETLLPGMVEAQRLRDAAFARTVAQAVAETGGPVAVITGNGHARRDWGLPAALALAAPGLSLISIGQLEEAPAEDAPYDFWLVTEAAERGDPCAGLKAD
ncbi:MAG: ChaN family lipoprotein [Paracoccaceae bacterium]